MNHDRDADTMYLPSKITLAYSNQQTPESNAIMSNFFLVLLFLLYVLFVEVRWNANEVCKL